MNYARRRGEPETAGTWRERAACRGAGDAMFPHPSDTAGLAAAIAVCAGCHVTAQCREEARRLRPTDGVWAGVLRGRKVPA